MRTLIIFIFLFISTGTMAQAPSNPVEYIQFLTSREQELSKKYLSYMSEVAHGNRARKMEKRRQELLAEIKQSIGEASRLKPYHGDASLRDAFKNYWDILFKVFNEDYHKIVDMEEIAEQSYDNMEAYLLAQEKAGEVLNEASKKIDPVTRAFAASNNVQLVDGGETKMDKKLKQVGRANSYYHQIFLIFFKSYKQDAYVWDAFNKKDVNGLEQNRSALLSYATEGLNKLDTIKAFDNDASLINACRKVLTFHKNEAENQIPSLSKFLIQTDEFAKQKKQFDAKPEGKRTQQDVDQFNKSVKEVNTAIGASNKTLDECNNDRKKVTENWEETVKRFMENHIPKGK